MSERMNKDRAREILQEWKKGSVKFIQQGGLMEKAMEKDFFEYQQALDLAINCIGALPQIQWERDIAVQQLNELGYELGEKIREEDKRVKIISETIDGVKTGLIIPEALKYKADKE